MNINDFELIEEVPKNIWEAIFAKQMAVAQKYKDIENMGSLLEEKDNINTANGQKWIKDFSWRVTEELAEAREAILAMSEVNPDDKELLDQYEKHYTEELIDALHFLTELSIIAGYDYNIVPEAEKVENEWDVVYQLGLMCNCLKNKPWKQTQMLTDKPKFEGYLKRTWAKMYGVLKFMSNMTDADIFNLYFKKNEVNKFRIRSKY
jgi:dimeric dUTPase (all-alpha-NTP-PPase superfamily)